MTLNNKTLNSEIETFFMSDFENRMLWALNNKTLNSEIETDDYGEYLAGESFSLSITRLSILRLKLCSSNWIAL